ncbi:MAG: nucleotide exchange factor GrpE [Nitrospinales bacterium]
MNNESTQETDNNPEDDQEELEIEELNEGEVESDIEEEPLSDIDAVKAQLAEKDKTIKELVEKSYRDQADTENFRKRIKKEKTDSIQYANEKFIKEILPISENLDRALSASNITLESLKEGVEMISKQFIDFLKKFDVTPIPAKGEKFDPAIHEVLSQIESADHEENHIVDEYGKGYYLNKRVLVPSKVVIAKKPADETATEETIIEDVDSNSDDPTQDTEIAS